MICSAADQQSKIFRNKQKKYVQKGVHIHKPKSTVLLHFWFSHEALIIGASYQCLHLNIYKKFNVAFEDIPQTSLCLLRICSLWWFVMNTLQTLRTWRPVLFRRAEFATTGYFLPLAWHRYASALFDNFLFIFFRPLEQSSAVLIRILRQISLFCNFFV
jgi:hypothetical protein